MIEKIDHRNPVLAEEVYSIFQVSYAVEAKLLNAVDFPPLKRSVTDFLASNTEFYGCWCEQEMTGVIEIKREEGSIHIQSLVVAPTFFRQGIASKLLAFVFTMFQAMIYTVETGVGNLPATTLYKKFGFKEVKQWNTDHGVRKVKFRREVCLEN